MAFQKQTQSLNNKIVVTLLLTSLWRT